MKKFSNTKLHLFKSLFLASLVTAQLGWAQGNSAANDEIPASQFLAGISQNPQGAAAFARVVKKELGALVQDPRAQSEYAQQLEEIIRTKDFAKLNYFPTLPLSKLRELRLGIRPSEQSAVAPVEQLNGTLENLLSTCSTKADLPTVVAPEYPDLRRGAIPDTSLSACQVDRSIKIAKILTALASNNGSIVSYNGNGNIRSPKELIAELVATGHEVVLTNERTYTNLVALSFQGKRIRWPIWLDTEENLRNGERLVVPLGHTQMVFQVKGPLMDARFSFFLGTDGMIYYPEVNLRVGWNQPGIFYKLNSSNVTQWTEIQKSLDIQKLYILRNIIERHQLGGTLPNDGYGYLGVCNDSVAVVEYLTRGAITSFPLYRNRELDAQPRLNDGLDDVIRLLPKDADVRPTRRDMFTRLLKMMPFALDSDQFFDAKLQRQMQQVQKEVAPN